MNFLDLTLSTPEENLASEEALLDWCETTSGPEILRVWEPVHHFVVLGYSNQAGREVNLEFCRRQQIPVLRRCTGGGTVLQGPGCLNYALILRIERQPELRSISGANDFIMDRQRELFTRLLGAPVEKQGHTDLTIGGLKFNGNAQRRHKNYLLFHGSFLLNLDIELMQKALPLPSRRPEYRNNRSHADFLVNLKTPPAMVKRCLIEAWSAHPGRLDLPWDRIDSLAREKYSSDEWNLRF